MVATIITCFVVGCGTSVPGVIAFLVLRKRRPHERAPLRWLKIIIVAQIVVSTGAVLMQARPDPAGADDYRGIFLLAISFLIFAALYAGILVHCGRAKRA